MVIAVVKLVSLHIGKLVDQLPVNDKVLTTVHPW